MWKKRTLMRFPGLYLIRLLLITVFRAFMQPVVNPAAPTEVIDYTQTGTDFSITFQDGKRLQRLRL